MIWWCLLILSPCMLYFPKCFSTITEHYRQVCNLVRSASIITESREWRCHPKFFNKCPTCTLFHPKRVIPDMLYISDYMKPLCQHWTRILFPDISHKMRWPGCQWYKILWHMNLPSKFHFLYMVSITKLRNVNLFNSCLSEWLEKLKSGTTLIKPSHHKRTTKHYIWKYATFQGYCFFTFNLRSNSDLRELICTIHPCLH